MTRLAIDHEERKDQATLNTLKAEFVGKKFEDEDGKWVVCDVKKSRRKNTPFVVYYHDAKIAKADDETDLSFSTVAEVRQWIMNSSV